MQYVDWVIFPCWKIEEAKCSGSVDLNLDPAVKLVILYGSVVAFNILMLVGNVDIHFLFNWREPMILKGVLKIHEMFF